jgi:hypothetical protein
MQHDLSFHIDFSELAAGTSRLIWRATQLAAFALSAIEKIRDEEFGPLTMPDALIGVGPQLVPQPQTRQAFRQWIIGCSLRDAVEAILLLLDEVRRILAIARFAKGAQITGEAWLSHVDAQEAFHRIGLGRKLETLAKDFGLAPAEDLTGDLLSLNMARNCLVHRLGRVAKVDCNDADTLRVSWLGMEMRVAGADTSQKIESLPAVMEAGAALQVVAVRKVRTFAIGEQLEFSTTEFSDIALFLQTYTAKIATLTQALAGLPVKTPESPTAS